VTWKFASFLVAGVRAKIGLLQIFAARTWKPVFLSDRDRPIDVFLGQLTEREKVVKLVDGQ
jgi:hypothetical protein